MKARARLIALVVSVITLLIFSARTVSADRPKEHLSDGIGAVSRETAEMIEARSAALIENCEGAEIFVMLVKSIGGGTIESYAANAFKKLGIGDPSSQNGVLILMAADDREFIILPGKGLLDAFTDDVLTEINAAHCQPYFSAGNYDKAVSSTFLAVNDVICAKYGVDPRAEAGDAASSCSCSCRDVGIFSLIACVACVAADLGGSSGGGQ